MEFLAVTGVEDLLQDNVLGTIEKLRQAGISIWMLTGDKIETARCIAISTGLKDHRQGIFEMREMNEVRQIEDEIRLYNNNVSSKMLMIDGSTLDFILEREMLSQEFFSVASKAESVCICRCSPNQKAKVAELIR